MTHYQKIAAMIFRILGITALTTGLILIVMYFIYLPSSGTLLMSLVLFLPYLIGGSLSFALSQFLAKLVCYDFDKSDEQK